MSNPAERDLDAAAMRFVDVVFGAVEEAVDSGLPKARVAAALRIGAIRAEALEPSLSDVIVAAAAASRLTPDLLTGARIDRRIAWPRQAAMKVARDLTGGTCAKIAKSLGRRDHACVSRGVRLVEERLARGHGPTTELVAAIHESVGVARRGRTRSEAHAALR